MDFEPIERLVVVHLYDTDTTAFRTTEGICRALDVGMSISDRVELLSALSSLREESLLTTTESKGRTVYSLTEHGTTTAAELAAEYEAETVELVDEDGGKETISVSDAANRIDAPSIATPVSRRSDGQLRLAEPSSDTFVGRDSEIEQLATVIDSVANGDRRTVTLVGERGVGKTELLSRVRDRARQREFTVVPVRCRTDPADPFDSLRTALAEHDLSVAIEHTGEELDDAGGLVTKRTALFDDLTAAIGELDTPVLVTIDDYHEAADVLVEFVSHFADRLPEQILLLVATRPLEFESAGDSRLDALYDTEPPGDRIELGPLNREQARELAVRQLGDRSVPTSLTDRLYERTGGTPLFHIELLAQLAESGAVDPAAGVYPAADEPLPLPDDVTEAVAVRLDALDDTARTLLEDAAILGQTLDPDVLKAISDNSPTVVQETLELLTEAGLLDDTDGLQFLSEIVRDVLLEDIDPERRRRRHVDIARAYERIFADPPHALIARHYEAAGLSRAALYQYRAAGEAALDSYAHETALDHYERALSIARELDAPVAPIVESIGRVYFLTGEYDDADRYFEYLRESTDDPHTVQRSYRYQSEIALGRGDISAADEYANRGIGAVKIPTETTCRLVGHRGWFQMKRGNFDAAEEWFERQHTLAKQLDNQDRLGGAYHNLGTLAHDRGDIETAINYLERAVEHNEAAGADRDALASYNNLARSYTGTGRIEEAIETYKTIRERATKMGDRSTELLAKRNLSTVYHNKGNLDQALETAVETKQEAQNIGLERFIASSLCSEGNVAIDQCSFERAGDCLTEALHRHETTENARMIAYTRTLLARLELYNGHLEAAHEQLTAAADYEDQVEPDLRAAIAFRRSDVARAEGRHEAAIEACNQALDYLQPSGHKQTRIEIRSRLGEAQAAAPNNDTGLEHAQWAVDAVAEFELPLLASRAHVALASCHRSVGNYGPAVNALDAAEGSLAETDAPLYESLIAVERALLAAARGDDDASDRLDVALELSSDRGILLFADRCRETLSGLCPPD